MIRFMAILLILLAGCAATPSRESENVRIITSEAAKMQKCRHLTAVASVKSSVMGGMPSAHVDAKNKVAAAGGNAFAITSQATSAVGSGNIAGDAYACPH